ncbi:hypothetical protein FB384_005238, partial [Prauserella sediminis]|nr:hypothetical protein [Prauserella sediminis]
FAVGQTAFTGAFNLLMGSLSAQLHDALAAALEET